MGHYAEGGDGGGGRFEGERGGEFGVYCAGEVYSVLNIFELAIVLIRGTWYKEHTGQSSTSGRVRPLRVVAAAIADGLDEGTGGVVSCYGSRYLFGSSCWMVVY